MATAEFNDRLLRLLDSNLAPIEEDSFQESLKKIVDDLTAERRIHKKGQKQVEKGGRVASSSQKNSVNIRLMFEHSIRCEICGGIMSLRLGTQYDHITQHAIGGATAPDNLRPTHQFCNNQRDPIIQHRDNIKRLKLPVFKIEDYIPEDEPVQLSLFARTDFPD